MTRRREFTTATARRLADPIIWQIDDREYRVDPYVDLARLSGLIQFVEALPDDEGDDAARMGAKLVPILDGLRSAVGNCLLDQTGWDEDYGRRLSLDQLMDVAMELIEEVTGKHPSSPSDSSEGSSLPGPTSTDGAPPAV